MKTIGSVKDAGNKAELKGVEITLNVGEDEIEILFSDKKGYFESGQLSDYNGQTLKVTFKKDGFDNKVVKRELGQDDLRLDVELEIILLSPQSRIPEKKQQPRWIIPVVILLGFSILAYWFWPEKILLHSYIGKTEEEAIRSLEGLGLDVVIEDTYEVSEDFDVVVAQDPEDIKVRKSSSVKITVARGIKLPNVIGDDRSTAERKITAKGLLVFEVKAFTEKTARFNEVINQHPSTKDLKKVAKGKTVVVSIAEPVCMPSIFGKTEFEVRAIFKNKAVGLIINKIESPGYISRHIEVMVMGTVVLHYPFSNTLVAKGSIVDVYIAEEEYPFQEFNDWRSKEQKRIGGTFLQDLDKYEFPEDETQKLILDGKTAGGFKLCGTMG